MKTSPFKLIAVKLQALWCTCWLRYQELKRRAGQRLDDPPIPVVVSGGSGTVSVSYSGCFCGAGCAYYTKGSPTPCWGEARPVAEVGDGDDVTWIHACEGHAEFYDKGIYLPVANTIEEQNN
jgi:hypothetical protein